ncbi:hypothetical protein HZS55_12410 [Halosimplex rubrum]|uniref:Tetrapyrrole biosynthesis glutamyl-tRNA reductase dimerisation domain-containing protein n=1 Tax=Halosimplex rubrum TaxID=869889 RepID=A0A7D5TM54_9EURY|nr:hypothetical protein [Halosimplex rubrum]QLH78052.1 hypothetical protein HZS55_12410 [Halosimplex rubrum]
MTGVSSAPTVDHGEPGPDDDTAAEDPDRAADGTAAEAPDPETALTSIRERGAAVRDREVETALAKLDARGSLSAADREAVEVLADRVVARLLSAPERSLRTAADGGDGEHDPETVETALALFGE